MRPSQVAQTLKSLIEINRPVHIEGSPGLGKTQVAQQVTRELGIGIVQMHVPTLQPEDIALPAVTADRTKMEFLVSKRFPVVGDENTPERGVIVFDELPQGDNSIQKTLANVIQEREIHGHPLKSGWAIVTTGNKQSDRAGANRILSHLRNRMTTIQFEPHLDDWCGWALDNGVKPEVVSFLRFKSALLCDFNPQNEINPTPRAWAEGVSTIIDVVPKDVEFDCIAGAVGEGAAAEFYGFLKIARKLPNPDLILLNPSTHDVPTDPATLYALAGAMAHRASPDNFDRVLTYVKRMAPEFMVLTVRDAARIDPKVVQTRAFTEWAAKEGSKVLM